jgi:hypothetical protein
MEILHKKHVHFLAIAAIAAFTINISLADDLNPPAYRGDPLSVYAHWQGAPGTPFLLLDNFNAVDNADPLTFLDPLQPPPLVLGPDYLFELPNFVDDLPIKYMRLQLTWELDPAGPDIIDIFGEDSGGLVSGNIVYTSPLLTVDPAAAIFYQYYDIEFKPNPDLERWFIISPNAPLVQVVVDTVSTVPEPATMILLGLGGLLIRKRK